MGYVSFTVLATGGLIGNGGVRSGICCLWRNWMDHGMPGSNPLVLPPININLYKNSLKAFLTRYKIPPITNSSIIAEYIFMCMFSQDRAQNSYRNLVIKLQWLTGSEKEHSCSSFTAHSPCSWKKHLLPRKLWVHNKLRHTPVLGAGYLGWQHPLLHHVWHLLTTFTCLAIRLLHLVRFLL